MERPTDEQLESDICVLVAVPTDIEERTGVPYTRQPRYLRRCSVCGRWAWLGERQKALEDRPNIIIVCMLCLVRTEGADVQERLLSLGGD